MSWVKVRGQVVHAVRVLKTNRHEWWRILILMFQLVMTDSSQDSRPSSARIIGESRQMYSHKEVKRETKNFLSHFNTRTSCTLFRLECSLECCDQIKREMRRDFVIHSCRYSHSRDSKDTRIDRMSALSSLEIPQSISEDTLFWILLVLDFSPQFYLKQGIPCLVLALTVSSWSSHSLIHSRDTHLRVFWKECFTFLFSWLDVSDPITCSTLFEQTHEISPQSLLPHLFYLIIIIPFDVKHTIEKETSMLWQKQEQWHSFKKNIP